MESLEALVADWLTLPDIADHLGLNISRVHRLIEDRQLIAVRVGDPEVRRVPAAFLGDGEPVPSLRGTLMLLHDAGYSDAESIAWLFTADETLPGRPIDQLREGRKAEVRRRAQALAF